MNNNDIRQYKIQYIENMLENENDKGHSLCEIKDLEYDLIIDNGDIYDKYLKKLGYGLKYYNILKYYYSKEKDEDLFDFIDETKLKIRNNILEFFNISKDFKDEASNLKILGSFSTDVDYSKNNILNIIKNIPFKYFDIIQCENIENFKIIFSFPLVGEIVNEIYSEIINTNPSIYINLTKFELDGGEKGKFFEKVVTYHLNIESSKNKEKEYIKYFQDYPIRYHDEMEVLVLNDNEEPEKVLFKTELKKGVYLITQKRYNGKALDIAIINVSDISEIIGIQISIRKKKVFTKKQIFDFLLNLKYNIKNYYDLEVKEKGLYFCYIFDWNNKENLKLEKFKKNGLKYFFFDIINDNFKDNSGNKIINLKEHLLSLSSIINLEIKNNSNYKIDYFFSIIPKSGIEAENETLKQQNQYYNFLQGPLVKINDKQNNSIKLFFKNDFRLKSEPEIKYKYSIDYFNDKLIQSRNDFCISKFEGNNKNDTNSIIMYTNSTINKVIKENGEIYHYIENDSKFFDYYEVNF